MSRLRLYTEYWSTMMVLTTVKMITMWYDDYNLMIMMMMMPLLLLLLLLLIIILIVRKDDYAGNNMTTWEIFNSKQSHLQPHDRPRSRSIWEYRPVTLQKNHFWTALLWDIIWPDILTHWHMYNNGRHFSDGIFKHIFLNNALHLLYIFHWSLFLRVQLTIRQHRFG